MLKYFKCNIVGGFRLSDVNKNVKQGQYFELDAHVTETSRSAQAAIKSGWMVEVTEKEASKVMMPQQTTVMKQTGVSLPNVKITNQNIESRQSAYIKSSKQEAEEKVATPVLKDVEKKISERTADTINNKNEIFTPNKPNVKISKEAEFDNSLVSVPDLEKKEEIKKDLEQQIEKKVGRRKKIKEEVKVE